MGQYKFFPAADREQDKIWRYTVSQWGEEQAETYIRELHQHLQKLADKRLFWHSLPSHLIVPPDLKQSMFFSQYQQHYIFFRTLQAGQMLGVMRILHVRSDLPVRLATDLRLLALKVGEQV